MTVLDILHALRDQIKRRLPISLFISLILAVLVGFYYNSKPGVFSASARIFPLSANSTRGASSPVDQIRAQFGLDLDGGNNEVFDLKELIESKRLSFKVANAKPNNKKYKHFYNWLVEDHNNKLPFYAKKITLKETKEDSLANLITGRGMLLGKVKVDKSENGYTSLTVTAYDKELAKELNENILIALSEFYIDFVTEKPRTDLYQIQNMRDSLGTELSAVERAMAGYQDQSAFASKAYVGLPLSKLERRKAEIEAIYSTTVAALQNARFKLLSESPIFQILDYPGEPYGFKKESWKKNAIITFILSMLMLSLWFCRKIFGQIIVEELKKA